MSFNYYTSFVLETNIYFNITVAKICVAQEREKTGKIQSEIANLPQITFSSLIIFKNTEPSSIRINLNKNLILLKYCTAQIPTCVPINHESDQIVCSRAGYD